MVFFAQAHLILSLSLSCLVHGAYVQAASCHGENLNLWELNENYRIDSARLERHDGQTQLFLDLGQYLANTTCEDAQRKLDVAITVDVLGRHNTYQTSVVPQCLHDTYSGWQRTTSRVVADLKPIPAIGTLHTTVQISSTRPADDGCLSFNITPAFSKKILAALTWTPLALFVGILLVNAARVSQQGRTHSAEPIERPSYLWIDVGDYLSHLQFIFLSSCLSLRYPGFFQPVTSNLHWFSLFNKGPLTHGHVYTNIFDGIYVVNGTYGGTFGFEHMHQIVGAPMTADTWWNFLIALAVVFALAIILLEVVRLCTQRSRTESGLIERHTFSTRVDYVLRIVLSLFTLPLCSMAFYQVNYANVLPSYHTASAISTLAAFLAAFIWLGRRLSTEALGSVVTISLKQTQKYHENIRRQQGRYRTLVFILIMTTLLRGAVVGALQHYGTTQLALLLLCDICNILAIAILQPHTLRAKQTALVGVRLAVLSLLCCFIPGATSDTAKDAVGYTMLLLHAVTLFLAFLLPSSYQLMQLLRRCSRMSSKQVTSFQLLEQDGRLNSSPPGMRPVEVELQSLGERQSSSQSPSSSDSIEGATNGPSLCSEKIQEAPGYFREPRAKSMRMPEDLSKCESVGFAQHASVSPESSSHASRGYFQVSLDSPSRLEISHLKTEVHVGRSDDSHAPMPPLGPRWHDFSFRESDLVYGAPDHAWSAGPKMDAGAGNPNQPSRPVSVWASLTSRASMVLGQGRQLSQAPRQSGFQVLRPAVIADPAQDHVMSSASKDPVRSVS